MESHLYGMLPSPGGKLLAMASQLASSIVRTVTAAFPFDLLSRYLDAAPLDREVG